MDLLYRIPMGVLRAYGKALPMLQARESLLMAERLGVGTGALSKETQRNIRKGWTDEARVGRGKSARTTLEPERLASMGIKFRKVPKTRA